MELNRAVAVAMATGRRRAWPLLDPLADGHALADSHLLPSVRGDLLEKLGRSDEARVAFEHAAALAGNERERDLLTRRAVACSGPST